MKSSVRLALFAILAYALWIAAIAPAQAAETELRVIPLKHRLADEVVPVVRPLLAPGESVSGMDARLIVRTAPQTFAQIERLLTEIDTPRRNLRISVRHTGENGPTQGGQGFSGNAQRGSTRIIVTNGDRATAGTTSGKTGTGEGEQGSSERHISTKRDTSTQTLTVLDGGHAFLHIGETIAQVQPFLALAGSRLGVVAGIQYYDVTTGFEVEPRVLGEQIQLAVTPRLAFRSNQGEQAVIFQELHTQVMVKPGEWMDLGGAVESTSTVSRQILSTGSEGSRFLIRVDPQ
jgi:type II secretory pathway component GspD/PulD (secretin)